MNEPQVTLRRRYELDWLRVFAIAVVFLFHCGRFFDSYGWHLKNAEKSPTASLLIDFAVQWMMPLFFLISGASTWYSLQKRGVGSYLVERIERLVVPLIFGILVLVPPQVYLERLGQKRFSGSFFEFFPHYFEGFYGFGGNFAWMGLHLWYLLALFLFSMLALPLFLAVRARTAQGRFALGSLLFSSPLAIYLLPVPISLLEVTLDPRGLGMKDFGGWNLFAYLIFFALGYLLYSQEQHRETVRRWRRCSLTLALVALGLLLNFRLRGAPGAWNGWVGVLRGFHSWFWLLTIVGFALEHLHWPAHWVNQANEQVMPFYILHQTVILVLGYFVIAQNLSVLSKFMIIVLGAGSVIALLCSLIRRWNPVRYLFGMRPQGPRRDLRPSLERPITNRPALTGAREQPYA